MITQHCLRHLFQLPTIPDIEKLKKSVSAFKEGLSISDEKIREIELNTREQRESTLWFQVRRYRIISFLFGQVPAQGRDPS